MWHSEHLWRQDELRDDMLLLPEEQRQATAAARIASIVHDKDAIITVWG